MRFPFPRPSFLLAAAAILAAGVLLFALSSGTGDDGGDAAEANAHAQVGKVPRAELDRILHAVDAVNTGTSRAALVAEGRRLFRSTTIIKPGESCASCHTEGGGTNPAVGTILHTGAAGDFAGPRDPPSLWGAGQSAPYGWAGNVPTLSAMVVGTIRGHFAAGATQDDATTARQTAALMAYVQTLRPPSTDFDRGSLSPSARSGEALFVGKGACAGCHGGPLLTDNALHNTGVPLLKPGDNDFGAAASGPLKGAFNTPQLRDVRNTAPYMHNGSIKTLRDVIDFYNTQATGIAPLRLTPQEVTDLVAYLESL